jgi:hypothetical protein
MNTLERIEKMEKELAELKELVSLEIPCKENYKPRPGEICEFGDADDYWVTTKFVKYDNDDVYPYVVEDANRYMFCRPLNDPMVIQLIPYSPGEDNPLVDKGQNVIVIQRNGFIDCGEVSHFYWGECSDSGNDIVGYKVIKT